MERYLLGSASLGNSQTDTKNGIGSKLGLVLSAIKTVQESINLGLVLDINGFLDQSWPNDGVDILNSFRDTLAAPLGLVTVAKFTSFVLTCVLG